MVHKNLQTTPIIPNEVISVELTEIDSLQIALVYNSYFFLFED